MPPGTPAAGGFGEAASLEAEAATPAATVVLPRLSPSLLLLLLLMLLLLLVLSRLRLRPRSIRAAARSRRACFQARVVSTN